MRAWTWTTMLVTCAALGCGDSGDGGGGTGGVGATGGFGATGGTVAATGGTGGTIAGTTGGTLAGMTGAGTGGTTGGGTVKTCADYAASGAARGTRADVELIFRGDGTAANMFGSCAFSSCHQGAGAPATLDVTADFATSLVSVPSCQAAGIMRVAPGDPSMSWLWIKLTGPYDPVTGAVTYPATSQACAETPPATPLGGSMPWTGGGMPIALDDAVLYQICTWIEDGAL